MLSAYFASTAILRVTLTNEDGDVVTSATVTVTITDRGSSTLVEDAEMVETDPGVTGIYEYTISPDLLDNESSRYLAKITAVKDLSTRYHEVVIDVTK